VKQNKEISKSLPRSAKAVKRQAGQKRASIGRVRKDRQASSGIVNADAVVDREVVQTSPYAHLLLKDGKILKANLVFAKMVGYRSTESLFGKRFSSFLSEQSRKTYQLVIRRMARGEWPWMNFEMEFVRKGGRVVSVEAHFAPAQGLEEPLVAVHCNDITERKSLQNRLIDSESLFRNVVNSMGDALIITDLKGKVLDVNREFERLTGFTRSEALGKEIPYPWVEEVMLREYLQWLDRLRKDGSLRDFDMTWVTKDGRRIAVSVNTALLRSTAGNIAAMANVARDISERRAAQMELKNQVQRLEVLYELGRSLTGTLDPGEIARIVYAQVCKVIPTEAFFLMLYDQSNQQLYPLLWYDRVDTEIVEYERPKSNLSLSDSPACWRVIREGQPILELRSSENGTSKYTLFGNLELRSKSLMFVPLFSRDRIIGVLSAQSYEYHRYSNEHLTLLESIASVAAIALEKATLYQETVTKSKEIEARNRELDDFTYVVSHDLKEPLISVEGYAKILKQAFLDQAAPEAQGYVKSIIESCGQMKKLIEDLLQLSRVSRMDEQRKPLDVDQLVRDLLNEFEFTIRERNVVVRINSPLPSVVGVEPHVKIVFRNLISNAIKFCDKPRSFVEISGRIVEGEAQFSVKDNGIGIEEKFFQKIFMIFQRLHQREEYEGTGAGLTMVKKIIEAHRGRIWVESVPGEGSTFYFTLPAA
jgi:PAS domain S-box-containing protein